MSEVPPHYQPSRTVSHFRKYAPRVIAILLIPFIWMATDRTPPLELYDGQILPTKVHSGDTATVVWKARYRGSDCGGNSQRETVSDVDHSIRPQLARARGGIFHPSPENPLDGTVTTPPYVVPNLPAGPARYHVTQFYYCNWLQRTLNWPIVQPSPWIKFEVLEDPQ